MLENDVDAEDIQTIDEIYIVKDANVTLRSNTEETIESERISGRIRPRTLTTDHLHKNKR